MVGFGLLSYVWGNAPAQSPLRHIFLRIARFELVKNEFGELIKKNRPCPDFISNLAISFLEDRGDSEDFEEMFQIKCDFPTGNFCASSHIHDKPGRHASH